MRGLAISFRHSRSRDRSDVSTSQCGLRVFGDGIPYPHCGTLLWVNRDNM
jgi:hypothetical protein